MTPFEIFRSPLNLYRLSNGLYVDGRWFEGSRVTLSADFVTGNSIAITLNGIALTPVPYTTSQRVTMELIAAAILAQPNIKAVSISDSGVNLNRVLTIEAYAGSFNVVTSFVVTGGVSQPTVTVLNAPTLIEITASIQPTSGEDMELLPEGRHAEKTYKLYTSTQILTVTNENPDQIEIFGERYEVLQVFPWQNNLNFALVNHFKFIAMKIDQLRRP